MSACNVVDIDAKKERAAMSKKLRFDVFKRDSFCCQYCGESAPNVILHADHIKPISKGGKTEMLNLVTSCAGCNGGKGARELSDDSAVSAQKRQLAELQEKRIQLDMMLEWRSGVQGIDEDALAAAVDAIEDYMYGHTVNEYGKKTLNRLIKKHGLPDVFKGIDQAADVYLKYDDDGYVLAKSASLMFNKLGGICKHLNASDFDKRKHYVKGICRNRFSYFNEKRFWVYMTDAHEFGVDITEIEAIAKTADNWTQFVDGLQEAIDNG